MLKQTSKGLLLVCDECEKIFHDLLNRPLYFKNKNSFYLHYAYIESKGWRADKYCDVCIKWLDRIDKERKDAVEYNKNWYITLRELKNAVKFAEEYGDGDCKVIGIGHDGGNIGDNPYVFDKTKGRCSNISEIYKISLVDDEDNCW